MIDFKDSRFIITDKKSISIVQKPVQAMLIDNEQIIEFYAVDRFPVPSEVLFTSKRIIICTFEDPELPIFTFLPYSKFIAFSVKNSNNYDLENELELYNYFVDKIAFEFPGKYDLSLIIKLIGNAIG
ncbi:MAG: PH domain-containing protein [Acetobacterium sp.]|nr:PH domain-containing protein [Acetobacterium sp.]